jgi:ABC-type cobalamin/Fe3+-siderophores transport system ATPase subunit
MIVEFQFNNWKSYLQASLSIDSLTVLIGNNASGKSNILDGILFLTRIASGSTLTSALQGDSALTPLRGGIEWAPRKPGTKFGLGVTIRTDEHQDLIYRIDCIASANKCEVSAENLERVTYRKRSNGGRGAAFRPIKLFWTDPVDSESPTVQARLYNEKGGTLRQLGRSNPVLFQLVGQKSRSEIQEGVDAVITALRQIFVLDAIPSHMRGFSPLSDRLEADAGNIAGVLAALSDEQKKEVEKTLSDYVARLPEKDIKRVYAETVGRFKSDAMLYCEETFAGSKDETIDARGMSDGTLRFLAILTALLTRPSGSLLIVEEVDNGLHPSRSQLLIEVLKDIGQKREVDVMVTTHNPALLDAMGTAMVPFITVSHRNSRTGCSELTLLEDIEQLPKLLASGLVGRLSSQGLIEQALSVNSSRPRRQ